MTCEVQDIPPVDRPVRWGVALSRRWPLGALGLVMVVYGGLFALMLFYVYSSKGQYDELLDRGPTRLAQAEGLRVLHGAGTLPQSGDADLVTYRFTTEKGIKSSGEVSAVAGEFQDAASAVVQYLEGRPKVNRLEGTRCGTRPDLYTPVLGLVVFPGFALVLIWLLGALQLRQMLGRGDVAAAEPIRVERVRWVVPMMLRADYRFRDHHARWCEGHHWVRAHSPLGMRLSEMPARLAVVHDRVHPGFNRLVLPEDFAVGPRSRTTPQAARRA
jgi:hypothetical protein